MKKLFYRYYLTTPHTKIEDRNPMVFRSRVDVSYNTKLPFYKIFENTARNRVGKILNKVKNIEIPSNETKGIIKTQKTKDKTLT